MTKAIYSDDSYGLQKGGLIKVQDPASLGKNQSALFSICIKKQYLCRIRIMLMNLLQIVNIAVNL